jgi:hypothetical protein
MMAPKLELYGAPRCNFKPSEGGIETKDVSKAKIQEYELSVSGGN